MEIKCLYKTVLILGGNGLKLKGTTSLFDFSLGFFFSSDFFLLLIKLSTGRIRTFRNSASMTLGGSFWGLKNWISTLLVLSQMYPHWSKIAQIVFVAHFG